MGLPYATPYLSNPPHSNRKPPFLNALKVVFFHFFMIFGVLPHINNKKLEKMSLWHNAVKVIIFIIIFPVPGKHIHSPLTSNPHVAKPQTVVHIVQTTGRV